MRLGSYLKAAITLLHGHMSARFAIKEYTKRLSMMVNLSDDLGSNPANAKIIFSAVIVIKFKHTTF